MKCPCGIRGRTTRSAARNTHHHMVKHLTPRPPTRIYRCEHGTYHWHRT